MGIGVFRSKVKQIFYQALTLRGMGFTLKVINKKVILVTK